MTACAVQSCNTTNISTKCETIQNFFTHIPADAPLTKCKDKHILYSCSTLLKSNVLPINTHPSEIARFRTFVHNLNDAATLIAQETEYNYIVKIDLEHVSANSIFVFGDIHGDYDTMLKIKQIIDSHINDKSTHFVFLGDYVDRGFRNLDVLFELSALKVAYPQQIHLLRGNHESIDSYLICDMSKGNLLKAINVQSIPVEGKIEVLCSIANFFSSLPYVYRFNDCVFAHGEVATFDENIKYEPKISVLDYEPVKTLELYSVWGDYPNESRAKISSYSNKDDFIKRLTDANVHHYVKGHNHVGNNTFIRIANTDINYYIIISSLIDGVMRTFTRLTYDEELNEIEIPGSTYAEYMCFTIHNGNTECTAYAL